MTTDINTMLIRRHLEEREDQEIGIYPGETCNRWQEPDEDCPKPTRCCGAMVDDDGDSACDLCGETA